MIPSRHTSARLWVLVLLSYFVIANQAGVYAKDFMLFYLGGQSNMEGFGTVGELTPNDAAAVSRAFIYHATPHPDQTAIDGRGIWAPVRPGHGTGFRSDGKTNSYSGRFGLELSFARALSELYPDSHIALVKYARNGSSIAAPAAQHWGCWEPRFEAKTGEFRRINQYDQFLATIRNATYQADVDGDGEIDRLIPSGILWMQGESDAAHEMATAERYADNLQQLVTVFRAALRADDLPIVVGRISDSGKNQSGQVWKYGSLVRQAQQEFCDRDPFAAMVTTTDGYKYSDPWHYDTAGYLDLGKQFARQMHQLLRQQPQSAE